MRKSSWLDSVRDRWGEGPWQGEPDHVEWVQGPIYCVIQRTPMGTLCGYVGVPHGHPLYGVTHTDDKIGLLDVHGGLSFSARNLPGQGSQFDGHLWWFGFHCANKCDFVPESTMRAGTEDVQDYRNLSFVTNEVVCAARFMQNYLAAGCGND